MKHVIFITTFILFTIMLPAQEALKSVEEDYYDFLALRGLTQRPYLNYRTLSDSAWQIQENAEHPWQNQNFGTWRSFFGDARMRIYGPELFMSGNTAAPYGQNDGALWQGRGFNASLTGGIRLEGYGVELTFKPQLSFSQNAAFDIIQPSYSGVNYAGKAGEYGYYGLPSIDAPQRFGDEPFFTWDWGDSEIRYTWKTLTIGFGTQAVWLGPGRINSILHSNNAATYPKLDIGLRRQRVTLPWLGWYIGDVETRIWVGCLTESNYFDNDDSNNHNMITAFSFAYSPSFIPGFSLFVNRNTLTKWDLKNLGYISEFFFMDVDSFINQDEDRRVSVGANFFLPVAGIEVYGEIGKNDGQTNKIAWIRYPFHSMSYLVGLRKTIPMFNEHLKGELIFEWIHLEMSQDFQFQWPSTFYSHHVITQGYTNGGQWLGAGIGTGGNAQYLGFKVYYPKGYGLLYVYRVHPDNDYLYQTTVNTTNNNKLDGTADEFFLFNTKLSFGLDVQHFVTKHILIGGGLTYQLIVNPNYKMNDEQEKRAENITEHNFSIRLTAKILL